MKSVFVKRLNKNRPLKFRPTARSLKYDEKLIFKCDQQAAIISEKLLSFYKENEFFDTVLIAGSGSDCVSVQVHRVVLCALSEYFLEIFRGNQTTSKGNIIELKEIEPSTLKLIIDFMYTGSIKLNLNTVGEILRAASFLKMKTLVNGCCELIEKNINSSNSLKWFRIANELSLPRLKVKAIKCTYNHLEEISKEKELLTLSENELKDLLFNDNPREDFEESVFLSMVAWINYDKLNREHLSFQLLSMVRFQALTPKFIIENRKSVCKTVESYELICSWLQWHLSPETRLNNHQSNEFESRTISDELAVIRVCSESKVMNIETFNPEENSLSVKLETSLPTQKLYSSIINIGDKLILVGQDTKSVECLELKTLEWIQLPPMKKSRTNCQLADLKGYLCVFGANEDENSGSMEIFNFSTSKWHDAKVPTQPSKQSKIASHNGLLYILDLEYDYRILQCYNVSSNKWTSKSVEQSPLVDFGFAAFEGFLYILGGYYYEHERECSRNNVKRFNLSNSSWSEMASLPFPYIYNFSGTRTIIFKNKIIIEANGNVLEYNIYTNKWDILRSLSNKTNNILCTLRSNLINQFNKNIHM